MTVVRLAHSPDPDDAFMWWPLVGLDGGGPLVDTGPFTFELVHDDIESLKAIRTSLMPTDVLKDMTPEELRNLFAYLSLGAKK